MVKQSYLQSGPLRVAHKGPPTRGHPQGALLCKLCKLCNALYVQTPGATAYFALALVSTGPQGALVGQFFKVLILLLHLLALALARTCKCQFFKESAYFAPDAPLKTSDARDARTCKCKCIDTNLEQSFAL